MARSKSPNRTDEQRARHAAVQRKSYYKKKYGVESTEYKQLSANAKGLNYNEAYRNKPRASVRLRKSPNRTDEQRARHAAVQRKSYYKKKYGVESTEYKQLSANAKGLNYNEAYRNKPRASVRLRKSPNRTDEQRARHALAQRKSQWKKEGLEYTSEYQRIVRKEKEGTLTPEDIKQGLRVGKKKKTSLLVESLQNELVEEYGTSGSADIYQGYDSKEIVENLKLFKMEKQREVESYNYYLSEGLDKYREKKSEGAWE